MVLAAFGRWSNAECAVEAVVWNTAYFSKHANICRLMLLLLPPPVIVVLIRLRFIGAADRTPIDGSLL